jgi:hypothetical protein
MTPLPSSTIELARFAMRETAGSKREEPETPAWMRRAAALSTGSRRAAYDHRHPIGEVCGR